MRPSGENAGLISMKYPAGDDVNSLCSRLATDTKQMRPLSTTAISFPSGDQAKMRAAKPKELFQPALLAA